MGEHRTSDAEWDRRFNRLAREVATWSKDPDKKVGAVIVSADRRRFSIGYNGYPKGAWDRYDIPTEEKLRRTVHAELNAILNAGQSVIGCTLYCTKAPCVPCATAAVQAGLHRLVFPRWKPDSKWNVEHIGALEVLVGAGILTNLTDTEDNS